MSKPDLDLDALPADAFVAQLLKRYGGAMRVIPRIADEYIAVLDLLGEAYGVEPASICPEYADWLEQLARQCRKEKAAIDRAVAQSAGEGLALLAMPAPKAVQ